MSSLYGVMGGSSAADYFIYNVGTDSHMWPCSIQTLLIEVV